MHGAADEPNAFGSLPASACSLGAEGSFGPDRIVKSLYNAAGEVTQVRSAVGTPLDAAEASSTYRPNGEVGTLTDAENNRTTYEYDGQDRLSRTYFPSPTKGSGTSNFGDYEQQGYDAASNVTSFRNRAGQVIGFSVDALGRRTFKDLPGTEPDVSYGFDLLGRLTAASQSGAQSLSFSYDALGRQLSETGPHGTVSSQYDAAGRRTRLAHPDGFAVVHNYLVTGEMTQISQPGGIFDPPTVLASFGYDDLGRRTGISRANGTSTSYSYDPVSRLSQLVQNPAGTTHDLTLGFSYNPASQITSNTRSNDTYAWTGHGSGTASSPANGLNQLTSYGGAGISHDARGNVTYDPTNGQGYGYSSENLLTIVNGGSWTGTLVYDPAMRLYEAGVNSKTRFVHDGHTRIAEYSSSGAQTARYIHGPGIDEPLVAYSGSGLATRSFLHADERGSIVARSDDAGNVVSVGRYDEYGKTQNFANRFGFAGMPYETVSQLYYARNRLYNQRLPRFMQPDVIRYGDGPNMYIRTKGDPVNFRDPTGLCTVTNFGWYHGSTGEYLGPAGVEFSGCENAFAASGRGDGPFSFGGGGGGGGEGDGSNQCSAGGSAAGSIAIPAPQAPTTVISIARAAVLRALGLLASILSLRGDTQQPSQFRHYGYAADAAKFTQGLLPGSYATTASGSPLTGQQAQSLLALPARPTVPNAYYNVTVGYDTPVIGPSRVKPANGQPGGGVEYRFPKGTPPGSVGPPNSIPAC
jgi:RHS repeat-associated protein